MKLSAACGAWAGGLLAVALVAAALLQISRASAEAMAMIQQLSPAVWIGFVLLYLTQPVADMVIFRRLWRLPLKGFGVILRKVVINEVLFGYSGELYFYVWAKRQPGLSEAPFGAVKDVNILSALVGNVLTLVMLLISTFALPGVSLEHELGPALWPGLGVVALSFCVMFFSRKVFSLTRAELWFVARIHALRLLVFSCLTLLVWHLALPDVALGVWLVLLTSRLLLARLPFVANKDLVFANVVLVLFGTGSTTALLLATLAIATLALHLAVVAVVSTPVVLQIVAKAARRLGMGNKPAT